VADRLSGPISAKVPVSLGTSTPSKSDGLVVFEVWESRAKQATLMNEPLGRRDGPGRRASTDAIRVVQPSGLHVVVSRSFDAPTFTNDESVVDAQLNVGAHGSSRCASQPIRSRKILRTRFGS
jgi:hypothetical protein